MEEQKTLPSKYFIEHYNNNKKKLLKKKNRKFQKYLKTDQLIIHFIIFVYLVDIFAPSLVLKIKLFAKII